MLKFILLFFLFIFSIGISFGTGENTTGNVVKNILNSGNVVKNNNSGTILNKIDDKIIKINKELNKEGEKKSIEKIINKRKEVINNLTNQKESTTKKELLNKNSSELSGKIKKINIEKKILNNINGKIDIEINNLKTKLTSINNLQKKLIEKENELNKEKNRNKNLTLKLNKKENELENNKKKLKKELENFLNKQKNVEELKSQLDIQKQSYEELLNKSIKLLNIIKEKNKKESKKKIETFLIITIIYLFLIIIFYYFKSKLKDNKKNNFISGVILLINLIYILILFGFIFYFFPEYSFILFFAIGAILVILSPLIFSYISSFFLLTKIKIGDYLYIHYNGKKIFGKVDGYGVLFLTIKKIDIGNFKDNLNLEELKNEIFNYNKINKNREFPKIKMKIPNRALIIEGFELFNLNENNNEKNIISLHQIKIENEFKTINDLDDFINYIKNLIVKEKLKDNYTIKIENEITNKIKISIDVITDNKISKKIKKNIYKKLIEINSKIDE